MIRTRLASDRAMGADLEVDRSTGDPVGDREPRAVRPRIGYVLKRFPRLSETFILNEVLALERQGLAVEIFSLEEPRAEIQHAMVRLVHGPVTYLPRKSALKDLVLRQGSMPEEDVAERRLGELLPHADRDKSVLLGLRAAILAALARERGVRHLHAHFGTGAATVAMLAGRLSGIPYSFTAHAKDIYHEDVDRVALAEKIRAARFVVTVSDHNRRYLAQTLGRHLGRRVRRLYNGLDLARFTPGPAAAREEGLVLAVGRLVEKKGFQDLIAACRLLRERGRAFRCLIIGEGPEREALVRQTQALGLTETVSLPGSEPQERLVAIMRRATVFCLPCVVSATGDRDGLPTVLLEALAVGLPAISTTLPGIDEILDHGRTGLTVAPGDPPALAAAIDQMLTRPDLRDRFARTGRARAERCFDIERNARRLGVLLVRSALGSRQATAAP